MVLQVLDARAGFRRADGYDGGMRTPPVVTWPSQRRAMPTLATSHRCGGLMRHVLLAVLLLALPAAAADTHVGTLVTAGPSVSNTTTAAPFELSASQRYAIQCDAPAYVVAGATATAAAGVRLAAGQLYDVWLASTPVRLAIIGDGAAASCRVFRYSPPPSAR